MSSTDEVANVVPDDGEQVTAHKSSPDRIVFTEEGNNDGWIATDTTVELRR